MTSSPGYLSSRHDSSQRTNGDTLPREQHTSQNNEAPRGRDNCLHGGFSGFNDKMWETRFLGETKVLLRYASDKNEEGFL